MNQTESRLESSHETASHFWDGVQPRIMLVDEDPKIHTFFAHTFRHSGFEVDFETSGIKALHRIHRGYAVVISALYLLDMDGVELLKRIKQVDANIEMIIIGTSRSEDAISRVMRQGAMAYLSKPFESKSTVKQTVRRALERWSDTRNDEKLYHDIVSGLAGELNLGDNSFNLPFDTKRFPLIDLLSMMNDGFVFLDNENRITFSNVKFSRKINWPYRAVFQKQFIKYVLRENRLEFEQFLNQVRKERRTGIHETRMINRNGQVNHMMVTCRLIKIGESQKDVILLVITDITEQREAQERARQLATLVDRARFEAIIVFNEESLIIHCNQAAEEMFGYPEGKLLGTKLTDIFSIDFESAPDALIKSRPGESAFELEAIDIAGNRFPVEISEAEDQNGKPGARIGMIFARDIRKRKQAEADLLMANKQLTKMYQELLEARNAQRLFFANMSHELKTPLNSIGGYASLMRDGVGGELSDKHAKWVESIKTQSSRLLSMIQDILEYAKLGRSEQVRSPEPLDPTSLIQELKTTAIALVGHKPIAIYTASESIREHVVTDGEKLRHILMNILANAVKFTSKGEIKISLWDRSDSRIAFSISDTGCGIPEDKINKIFDDFYQVDESAASVRGSAGLGLAIVKQLVNSLGGTIEVESKPNHGSTFTVLLPIR